MYVKRNSGCVALTAEQTRVINVLRKAAIRPMHDLKHSLQPAGISCMLVFAEGGKPEYAEKNTLNKVENQNKLSPHMTYNPGFESRVTLVGDQCSPH